ncbi:MAG: MHYT domain-containing protein, partial [Terriglobales bacterium]
MTALPYHYNWPLVVLSVVIAIGASYAALDLAGRVTAARAHFRWLWLTGGACAMGLGIWSMHYIGMLAFRLPMPVEYDWPTVLLSLLAAIAASAVALFVVSRREMRWRHALTGSAFMGGGIAAMHYIGMAAMRLPAMCRWNLWIVAGSVLLAVLISLVALWLQFRVRGGEGESRLRFKLFCAAVMGCAIPVMHYTGMAAAIFVVPGPAPDLAHAVSISALGTAGITAVTSLVLALVVLTSVIDRRYAAQAGALERAVARLEQRDAQVRLLLDSTAEGIFSLDREGRCAWANRAAARLLGLNQPEELIGRPMHALL